MASVKITNDQVHAVVAVYGSAPWWDSHVSYDAIAGELNVPDDKALLIQNFDFAAGAVALSQKTALVNADANRKAALAALEKSDITLLRCMETGVAIPPEWTAYRKALRAIVTSGDALPARPDYPKGT